MFELLKDIDVSMMFDVTNNRMYQVLYVHGLTITSNQRLISPSAGVDKVIADILRSTDSNLSSSLTASLECPSSGWKQIEEELLGPIIQELDDLASRIAPWSRMDLVLEYASHFEE